ncbi:RICIN domain-containing protein [Streptomyces sp. DSM 40750]|uniref:RICIN domain-containing protein n=1 Tax=Streptomyces sp. DSM 40750 TaxID=2801030 RepID=UPI00214B5F50|nr:RICIN domain-containing protein [Streptomyces sp. DSM 40750]UUU22643.1 RICIN domain-containing protein [Streptomyces sp. DSM 40750]
MTRARDERPGDDDSHEDQRDTGAPGSRPSDASDARLTALLRADSPTAYPALRELRERHHPSVLAYARLCAASESAARQLATQAFTVATRETARGSEPTVPWRHHLLLLTARAAATWAADDHASGLAPALRLAYDTAGPDGPVPPPLLAAFQSLPPRAQGLIWYGAVEREPDDRTAVLLGLTPDEVAYRQEPALRALRQACLRVRLAASEDPRCQDFRRLIEESVRPDNPRHSVDLQAHMAHCTHCTGAYEELCALRDHPRATLAEGLLPWGGTAYARGGVGPLGGPGGRGGPGAHGGGRAGAGAEAAEDFADPGAGAGTGTRAGAGAGFGAGGWTPAAAEPWGEPGVGSDADGRDRAVAGAGAEAWTGAVAGAGAEARVGAMAGARGGTGGEAAVGVAAEAGAGAAAGTGPLAAVRSPSRRLVLSAVALGVALAPLLAFLVFSGQGDSSSPDAAGSGGTPSVPPPVSVTPTVPSSPTPSPTASRTEKPSKPPKSPEPTKSPSPSPSPSKADRATPSLPYGPPLNGAYTQVVNVASGLCLDIRGELEKGTDVVTAICSSRDTQRWRVDSDRDALQSFADPDLCLDSRGATDDGVGIWECDSLDGDNGENLRFEVDSRGMIRPAIAPDHAVTPDALGSVAFAEEQGRDRQRWRAGAGPVHD